MRLSCDGGVALFETVETTDFEIDGYLAGGDQVAVVGRETPP